MWKFKFRVHAGGVTAVGIDPSSKYLVVVSHSGRGVFLLSDGCRVARDYTVEGEWYIGTKCQGIGPLEGVVVRIYGIGSPTPENVLAMIPENTSEQLTEFKGAVISDDSKFLCVAYGDGIHVFVND
jgi:hypothetical protein